MYTKKFFFIYFLFFLILIFPYSCFIELCQFFSRKEGVHLKKTCINFFFFFFLAFAFFFFLSSFFDTSRFRSQKTAGVSLQNPSNIKALTSVKLLTSPAMNKVNKNPTTKAWFCAPAVGQDVEIFKQTNQQQNATTATNSQAPGCGHSHPEQHRSFPECSCTKS